MDDLVTRDNNGNIILPSKRFNQRKSDIRFQFVGEKGAEAADHAEEVTTRLDNLAVAREMEEAGSDAKAIKMATGWERGADKKWRYEIGDLEMKDPSEWINKYFVRLEDIVSGENVNELFAAYPELKEVGVRPSRFMGAAYDPQQNAIIIGAEYKTRAAELPSTLVHEIQHAIQELEGFALGGNPDEMDLETVRRALSDDYINAVKHLAEVGKKYGVSLSDVDEGWYSDADANEELRDAVAYYRAAERKTRNRPEERYMALGGETEARNAEKRMGMTPEERRASLAAETEDVSREDQIFLLYERDKEIELRKELDESYNRRKEILQEYGTQDNYDYRDPYDDLYYNAPHDKYVEYSELGTRIDQIYEELKDLDTIFVGSMGRRPLGLVNGQNNMGSRTNRRMAEIGAHYEGKTLNDEERAIVDVFSGKQDRPMVTFTGKDGKGHQMVMIQGQDFKAGSRHAIYRHYGEKVGWFNADELTYILDVVKNGKEEREMRGRTRLNVYQLEKDGVKYTVLTEVKKGKEIFNDFYTNRKASSFGTSNTPEEAHTSNDNALSVAKVGTNSETAKENGENLSEDKDLMFRTSGEIDAEYPNWLEGTTNDNGKHTTQIAGTVKTYQKVGEWIENNLGKGAKILDASSGMGLGTQALREQGLDIEDVEPYQSEERKANNPATYASYGDITGRYDYIISNAVLNVIPDDWRRDVLHDMAERLKEWAIRRSGRT